MSTVNRVMLIGFLGKDPEQFQFKNKDGSDGVGVRLRIATNDKRNSTEASWHTIFAFDKLAEQCLKFLAKGRQVYVEGTLQYKKVENTNYTDARIIAEDVQFLDRKASQSDSAGAEQSSSGRPPASHSYPDKLNFQKLNNTLSTLVERSNVKE